MRFLPCGDAAVLVKFDRGEEVLAHYRALLATRHHAVVDLVPAERTLLVAFDLSHVDTDDIVGWV